MRCKLIYYASLKSLLPNLAIRPRINMAYDFGSLDFTEDDLPENLLELKPKEPAAENCCGGGCNMCVYDVYDQELKIWKNECQEYLKRKDGCEIKNSDTDLVISPEIYSKFVLSEIFLLTRNCNIYTYRIPEGNSLKLEMGQHLILRGNVNGEIISRQYTPISSLTAKGYFKVMIKTYDTGLMSRYISTWQTGMQVQWRGPFGGFNYKPNTFKKIFMICGGTGIAPMIQIIHSIVENEVDETFVRLLFACRAYDDILLKSSLSDFKCFWNFTVAYFLSQEKDKNKGDYGDEIYYERLNKSTLSKELSSTQNIMVLICGPRSFDKNMEECICDIGVRKNQYFIF